MKKGKGKEAEEKKGGEKRRKGKRKRSDGDDEEEEEKNGDGVTGSGENEELDTYISMLEEGPLSPLIFEYGSGDETDKYTRMTKGPDGLRYHIMDIWLDELEKVCAEPVEEDTASSGAGEEQEEPKTRLKGDVPMDIILRPIRKLQAESPNKIVRRRAAGVLDDDRLVDWGIVTREKDSDSDDDAEWGGID